MSTLYLVSFPLFIIETILIVTTTFRIYLTESMGGVLGANVMRDHNVVFDYDNHLVGFAKGVCDYRAGASGPGGEGAEVCVVCGHYVLNIRAAEPCVSCFVFD